MKKILIKDIRKLKLSNLYKKLLTNQTMSYDERLKILKIAIILINCGDSFVKQLGYRIIVIYCTRYNCYAPLYEIAINQGLYPISHFIESNLIEEDRKNIFTELNESYCQNLRKGEIYLSQAQFDLSEFFKQNINGSVSIVAPTSYGKTDLIIDTIRMNPGKKICVITPTKSLLSQTRNRILLAKIDGISKIVVNPEMFSSDDIPNVAVLTQERLLRLLKDAPEYSFDYVIVDEAHDLLNDDERNKLLASAIIILNRRNSKTKFKFLTPFIVNTDNLKVRYTSYDLSSFIIDEYIKTERIYVYDVKGQTGLHLYDQFFNEWYDLTDVQKNLSDVSFLRNFGGKKNIVYFNKPTDIELFAKKIVTNLPDINLSTNLETAIKHISDYVSPEYTLVKCLRKGVVYHHGSIPDGVRQYVENLYSTIDGICYVLTSSTLLEGVNLPADKMFIFDNKKGRGNLSSSNFKNLIGRVSRFSEVFNPKNKSLIGLTPEIYLVHGDYFNKRSNYEKFVSDVIKVDKKICDDCKNVLLEETDIKKGQASSLVEASEFIENYESGIIENYSGRKIKTKIGECCIHNNIREFDVFVNEKALQEKIDSAGQQEKIVDCDSLLKIIVEFFVNLMDERNRDNYNVLRLKNESTVKYYTMFLKFRISNVSYSQMISKTVSYWETLCEKECSSLVYVGRWGDSTRNGVRRLWTDISKKNRTEKINLAIVRIKEEQDFIDNKIMKFVEVLHDVDLIEESFYTKVKYGTDNPAQMVLIKNGFSVSLSKLLIEKYSQYVDVDVESNTVKLSSYLIDFMKQNKENDILIYEANSNVF